MSFRISIYCSTAAALFAALACELVSEGPASAPELRRVTSAGELARMKDYIRELYDASAVVHSFRTAHGDAIDCVPLAEQPALRGPAMRGHVLQSAPRTAPSGLAASQVDAARAAHDFGLVGTDEDGAERRCPAATVPIRRLELSTLARFATIEEFRRKHPSHLRGDLPGDGAATPEPPAQGPTDLHQYTHAYQFIDNHGAQTTLNLWNPYTEQTTEFSLSQMWVVRGAEDERETIEAGWQNYHDLYGDYSRLFIYFTPDNYGPGGCYNLTCDGFVQINNSVIIGGHFANYSTLGGEQREITLQWFKDGPEGDWWLSYGGAWVGYYPRSRFDSAGLQDHGEIVDFGGEIIDTEGDGKHTATDMGSGMFASAGWQQAAFQRNILYIDTDNYLRDPALAVQATHSWCYSIELFSGGDWGVHFYFGGSGYNTQCE